LRCASERKRAASGSSFALHDDVADPSVASPPAAAPPPRNDRRESRDRRAEPGAGRRSAKPSVLKRWLGIAGRDLIIIGASVGAIVFAVRRANPIFANQPKVVEQITKTAPVAKVVAQAVLEEADTSRAEQVTKTEEFERDRKAFAADLVKTGRMDPARADSIAFYAVRESYLNGIPPAVVFGVMLTENARFVSGAMSNVGAVGLMQVYPKVWLKALSSKFGKDLSTDSTNLKYGVYILGQYIKSDSGSVSAKALSKGLLKYNGCVRGTNTPNCRTYPSKVKTYVEKQGSSICSEGFYACIARPFVAGLLGRRDDVNATQ
jgi:hypothetical protein